MMTRGQVAAAAVLLWALLGGGCGDSSPGTPVRPVTPCIAVGVDLDPESVGGGHSAYFCESDDDDECAPETLTTAGSVVDAAGVPVAELCLRFWRHGESENVEADANGEFEVRLPEGSDYEIGVELSGYDPISRREIGCDALDVRLELVGPMQRMAGCLMDGGGEPVGCTWIRFVPADGCSPVQSMTDIDGAFGTVEAHEVDYEAFLLVPADDGRLVRGPSVGRCRGGDRSLVLRTPR